MKLSLDRHLRRNGLPRFCELCEPYGGSYLPLIASKHFSMRNKVLAHSMQIWYKGCPPRRHHLMRVNSFSSFTSETGGIERERNYFLEERTELCLRCPKLS